jgi:hypothetical protein
MSLHNCPQCGSESFIPVVYGTLDETMIQRIESGEILHGGCAISGLMQALYCQACDVRYDDYCTDEFITKLRQLNYQDQEHNFTLDFNSDHITLTQMHQSQTLTYTPELKHQLSLTQIEYWTSLDQGSWSINLTLSDYFRDQILIHGNKHTPFAFKSLIDWFHRLNIKIH